MKFAVQQICNTTNNFKLDFDRAAGSRQQARQGKALRGPPQQQLQIFSRSRWTASLTSSKGIYKIPFYQDTRRKTGEEDRERERERDNDDGGGGNKFCVAPLRDSLDGAATVAGLLLLLDPMS